MAEHDDSSHDSNAGASSASRPPVDVPPAAPPPPPPGYQPPSRESGGSSGQHGVVHRLAVSLVTTVLLLSLALNIYFGVALYGQFRGGPREEVYRDGEASQRLVILPIKGTINGEMAERVRKSLRQLDKNPPAGLILRVSSGGGGVSASDQIWHYLKRFEKEHSEVPVVASYGRAAASGGYYVSVLSDWIVAEPTTMTGSIGVLAEVPTVEKLLDMVGVEMVVLEAEQSPRKGTANNVFRSWDEEDKEVLRDVLAHAYDQFFEVVYKGRSDASGQSKGMSRAEVKKIARGQVFTADQAKRKRVVDEIGYLDDAFAKAKALAKIDSDVEPQVTRILVPGPLSVLGLVTGQQRPVNSMPDNAGEVRDWLGEMTHVRIEYRMSLP